MISLNGKLSLKKCFRRLIWQIFNKTLLAISLAFAIPLSTQASWYSNLTNKAHQFSNLANGILDHKKTIAASAYSTFKFIDKMDLFIQPLVAAIIGHNKTIEKLCALSTIYQAHKQSFAEKA